jgi:hypothetical protein
MKTKTLEAMKKLRKALFKVGDVVEYLGERHNEDEKGNPLLTKGMKFKIDAVFPPSKGLGKYGVDDETGEDLIDRDDDGYNTYKNARGQGRIIWPENESEWRLVK